MNMLRFAGRFEAEAYDANGRLLWLARTPNTVLDAAINSIFNVHFNSGTQLTTWYGGLIDNSGFTSISASDTAASHAGWAESTAYSETTRQAWGQGTASGKSITNSSSMVFTINGTVTIKGGFIISNNTKGGTTGVLWSAGAFTSGTQSLVAGQTLKLTYTLSGASS